MDATWAYIIDEADEDRVLEGINAAPQYGKKVAGAIKRTIQVIHGLDRFFDRLALDEMEIYLGRSADIPARVLSRWAEHRKERGHKYAALLFTCETVRAHKLEGLTNGILKKFKEREALCVGNANTAGDGRGRTPRTSRSVIYMTWGKNMVETAYFRPGIVDIRDVAEEIYRKGGGFVTKQQLLRGLTTMKSKTNRTRLRWNRP